MALDIPMRFDEQPLLWTVENVYSEAECAAFIQRIEGASPRHEQPAPSRPGPRDRR